MLEDMAKRASCFGTLRGRHGGVASFDPLEDEVHVQFKTSGYF